MVSIASKFRSTAGVFVTSLVVFVIMSGCGSSKGAIDEPWRPYNDQWQTQLSYSFIEQKDALSQPKIEVRALVKNVSNEPQLVRDVIFAAENDKNVIVSLQTERPDAIVQPGASIMVNWQWNLGVGSGFDPFQNLGNIKIHRMYTVPVSPDTGRH